MPAILYGTAFLGFLVAAMGILSIRPFAAATRPVLVVAAGWSLVAIYRFGDNGLWPGAAIDLALLVIGLTGLHQWMPEPHANERGLKHAMALVMAVAFVAYAACAGVFWSAHRSWGTTAAEHQMALPGDQPDRNPALELQHAVTISSAPPSLLIFWVARTQRRMDRDDDPAWQRDGPAVLGHVRARANRRRKNAVHHSLHHGQQERAGVGGGA